MYRQCSRIVILGALLLCVCAVRADPPDYVTHEAGRPFGRICYDSDAEVLPFNQAANEQSDLSAEDNSEGEVNLDPEASDTWNLRPGCESGVNASTGTGLRIRNQNSCGACWAYAHNDFITLWHCQHGNTNDMTRMTEVSSLQQHVDCVPSKTEAGIRNAGCGTGSLKLASLYYMGKLTAQNIKGAGATVGFASEADYPMTFNRAQNRVLVRHPVHNHGQCMYQGNSPFPWGQAQPPSNTAVLNIDVGPLSELQMTYLFQNERYPFATTMYVDDSHLYIRQCTKAEEPVASVYNNPVRCAGQRANHAVVAVGMGRTDHSSPIPYWLIRNSWGVEWGDLGHIRLIRNSANAHIPGPDTDASKPGGHAMCSLGFMNSYPRAPGAPSDDSCVSFSFA